MQILLIIGILFGVILTITFLLALTSNLRWQGVNYKIGKSCLPFIAALILLTIILSIWLFNIK